MRTKKPDFTVTYLRSILRYNRRTGIFRWRLRQANRVHVGDIAGCLHHGYRSISVMGRQHPAHLLAWYYVHDVWPDGDLDHEDTVKHHNWISNLRPATRSQNIANTKRRRSNSSGYKGVSSNGPTRWMARIMKDDRLIFIGNYKSPQKAHAAYVVKATELFGEFANNGL